MKQATIPIEMSKEEKQHVERNEKALVRRAATCIYFNGLVNNKCKADIEYSSVKGADSATGKIAFPCLQYDDAKGGQCDFVQLRGRDAALEEMVMSFRKLQKRFQDIEKNVCPDHQIPITKRQVGACVYADPCGCRLYQGRL